MTQKHHMRLGLDVYLIIGIITLCKYETRNEEIPDAASASQPAKKRLNLNGTVLRVASITREPFQVVQQLRNGKYVGSGFSFEIVNEMAKYFNFSYEVITPKFEGYGKRHENGTWEGLIGTLVNKEAEIAAVPFTFSIERARAIRFSTMLFRDYLGILIKQPKEGVNDEALLAPFNAYVWVTIVIISILMGPALYLMQKVHYRIVVSCHTPHCKDVYKMTECAWFIYSALMKQGSDLSPTYDSTRIFFATWWLFTLVLTAFYTANLTAFLSLKTFTVERTVTDILKSRKVKWLALDDSPLASEILSGTGTPFHQLNKSLEAKRGQLVRSAEKALELTSTGKYAFFLDSIQQDYITQIGLKEQGRCIFSTTGYKFHSADRRFAFPKNYKYNEEFDNFLKILGRTGLIRKWIRQYLIPVKSCSLSATTSFSTVETALSLSDIKSAFVAYLGGMGISTFLFLVEKLWHWKRVYKHRRVPTFTVKSKY